MTDPAGAPPVTITRRALATAAAWSIPVVGLALAAPRAAASTAFDVYLAFAGSQATLVATGPQQIWITSNTDGVPVPVGYMLTVSYDPNQINLTITSTLSFTLGGIPGALTLTLQSEVISDDLMIFDIEFLSGDAPISGATTLTVTGQSDMGSDPVISAVVTVV